MQASEHTLNISLGNLDFVLKEAMNITNILPRFCHTQMALKLSALAFKESWWVLEDVIDCFIREVDAVTT
jgi:hypothetical protein